MDGSTWIDFSADADALILIHPTYNVGLVTPEYTRSVLAAVDAMLAAGKPVLVAPNDAMHPDLEGELSRRELPQIPNHAGKTHRVKRRVARRRLQREVDAMADLVGRPAGEIQVAFGGMFAEACVQGYAEGWCREIRPWWPDWVDDRMRRCLPRRPFARGEILQEISGTNDPWPEPQPFRFRP